MLTPISKPNIAGVAPDGSNNPTRPAAYYPFEFFRTAGVMTDDKAIDYTLAGGTLGGRKIAIPVWVAPDGIVAPPMNLPAALDDPALFGPHLRKICSRRRKGLLAALRV